MSHKTLSLATLSLLSAVLAGLAMLVGCGGSTSSVSTGTPAVTLSATTLTFSSGVGVASAPQSVTVTNSGTASLTFSGFAVSSGFTQTNTCGTGIGEDGACTVSVTFTPTATGTVSGTLTIADNASNSPQTVTLSGTGNSVSVSTNSLTFSGVAVGTTSAPQSVTLTNAGTAALAISSATISGDFSISNNTCGSSVAAGGSCTISVTFTPQGSGPWTGTLTIVDAAGTQTVALTGTTSVSNTAQVSVNLGPNNNFSDAVYTTVTVCVPGTTNCTTIPDVLVDTGSVGLRVLSTGAVGVTTQVGNLNLPQVTDPATGYPLYECVQYGDLSYNWGAMQMATVQVGGETASQVPASAGGTANAGIPIQVISTGTVPNIISYEGEEYYNPCTNYETTESSPTGGLDRDTVANLSANGILGIGLFPQDCTLDTTNYCTSLDTTTGQYLAYQASTGDAYVEPTALTDQAWNPVAAFPVDNNGEVLSLPSIPANGQATATGTLTFGIGTETNNAITTQTVYEVDCDGDFLQATFNGVNYNDVDNQTDCSPENSSFIDSGSNGLFFLDPTTLTSATGVSTVNCSDDADWYCPASTLDLSPPNLGLTLYGDNGTSGTVSLSIANADTLFSYDYAAYSDLAGTSISSGEPTSDDSIDLGLPFFFDRPIFVGISGGAQYPNGYWAF